MMKKNPWAGIAKDHPRRRHPNRRAILAARRARILKKRRMKEDQDWEPNKVCVFIGCYSYHLSLMIG